MKKIHISLLLAVLTIFLTSCGTEISSEEVTYDLGSYCIESTFSTTWYECYVYTNNSKHDISVSAPVTFHDSDGNYVDDATYGINCIAPGASCIIKVKVPSGQTVEHNQKNDIYKKSNYHSADLKSFDCTYTQENDILNLTVTNNSDKNTSGCTFYALYYDTNGKLIDLQSAVVNDGYLPSGEQFTIKFESDADSNNISSVNCVGNIYYQ